MEDALISPIGFMILSGAGLTEGTTEKPIPVHKTEQTDQVEVDEDSVTITLTREPYDPGTGENYAYVMLLDGNGEVVSEPYIPTITKGSKEITLNVSRDDVLEKHPESGVEVPAWSEFFTNGGAVLVDYYYAESSVSQIDITPEELGGNFYLEAETLFRDRNGVDMPAIFTIPNCRVQSNFTFSMAATGDPSTFSFVLDAFPDYTRFDKTKKVLASIQIISQTSTETELIRNRTQSADSYNADTGLITRP